MPTLYKTDPFNAVLLNSPALAVTTEQRALIREILELSSSDSRFSEKAYLAIERVLTGGNVVPPVVSNLSPPSAQLGSANFTLHVFGTGFTPSSIINFNGGDEPTTYVSATELTTGVDMSTAQVAVAVPVYVFNSDGVASDPKMFNFTSPVVASLRSKPEVKDKEVELGHELKEQKIELEKDEKKEKK